MNRSRLLAAWVASFALLGMTMPAWACTTALLQDDCCPADAPAPCEDATRGAAPDETTAACCLAAPVPVSAAAVVRTGLDKTFDPDLPDPWIDGRSAIPPAVFPAARSARLAHPDSIARDTAPVYLLTGRLRL